MDILDFAIGNDLPIYDIADREFMEFCDNIQTLDFMLDPQLYLEARVHNPKPKLGETIGDTIKGTIKTTGDIWGAYSDITTGGGNLIKSIWDFSMKVLHTITKIVTFILNILSRIPDLILRVFQKIAEIPDNIKNKVRGNIQLYISSRDVEGFYNEILPYIKGFVKHTRDICTKNNYWEFYKFWELNKLTHDDKKSYEEMRKFYSKLSDISFEKSYIEINNKNIIDTYFGRRKAVNIKTSSGNVTMTYYEALIKLSKDLNGTGSTGSLMKDVKEVSDKIGEKFTTSTSKGEFAELSKGVQTKVKESVTMVSKVISIIGNFLKYIIHDIKTIESESLKMIKAAEKTAHKMNEGTEIFEEKHPLQEKHDNKHPLNPGDKTKIDDLFGKSNKCSWAKDKNGYFCYNHRCRSKSYKTLEDIPKEKVEFVRSMAV